VMEYLLHILILTCIYGVLAMALDIVVGHAGLLSMTQAAFFGIGAYASALLTTVAGVPWPVGLGIGMVLSSLMACAIALPSLRVHDDYFVVATLGFQMVAYSLLNNWIGLTQGPFGVAGIPPLTVGGYPMRSAWMFALVALVFCGISWFVVARVGRSPFGRVLRAIREDEILVLALGKDTLYFKVTAFVVSGALAAAAGTLYAHYTTYVDPSSFTIMESILIASMVIIGGAGSPWGPILGAVVLVTIPEGLRFLGLPVGMAGHIRQVVYGSTLVLVMVARPRGIIGRYSFGR